MRFKSTLLLALCVLVFNFSKIVEKPKILVFTKTSGYHHASIAVGAAAIIKLGAENHFSVDTTSDAAKITEANLSKYSAVVFLSTTGYMLNNYQQADLERYMQAGGNYVGIHAAADAEYDWHWYGRLVGAYFDSHPAMQEAVLNIIDKNHPSTRALPDTWKRTDEWYNFKSISKNLHVLITIDENSYKGGTNGVNHPMAWYHNFENGRAFYTELGHTDESYSDPAYLKHLLGGIQYAIGDNKSLDYSKCTTLRVPEENRFSKTSLIQGTFYEPTEMTILPNLDILVTQRRGEIMLYKNATKTVKQAGFLDVYFKTRTKAANAEEGVLGIQADPDFKTNHFVYIYYSPSDTSVNRLSRFTMTGDTIDNKTEKVVLQLYSQREICCHTGGSIAFGPDRTLFVSTGDNTTPFDEGKNLPHDTHAFAPLDDRPEHLNHDSRRSAGNTNDLRGKILRIKMKDDGTYTIPEGNLFKPGTAGTKPEIYVMGDRNPYRIAVDKKNSYLYWGEVGPDANNDSLATRGPRGYDEFNQAKAAGFFGWPLFIGPNIPYHAYNYATGESGPNFDPLHPINDSKNNTGLRELPPAQPAFIWYPYGESKEFPQVGSGGRTAMAGPIYYADLYPKATRLPDYYNKKVFFYDWIRGWIKVLTLQPNGDLDKMEPFMATSKFNAPIDMETGPDGRIYVLEYGSGWFTKNKDAGLARIDYNTGNRAPEVKAITANKLYGKLPLPVTFTVAATDPEKDKMTYTWNLGNGIKKTTALPKLLYTYTKKGNYNVSVEVKDDQGAGTHSKTIAVLAGQDSPDMKLKMANMKANAAGMTLMMSLDCKACHKVSEKSVGPAFTEVAKKYANNAASTSHLVKKVTTGGHGVWGDVDMPAHPNLKPAEIKQIVSWIYSLK
ncbi:ThuA domain-containing protein [Mucilaginibacter sp. FT3.2]|uniref:ThuA domain-containing protein n=1 Tax=Mucilaginibacter sp. FT3.2 TaxID=2723090 RepID=UPI00160E6DFE|nr:ThuA domain-containing protein [Mucilaginibacter sp. FT3.2]MBB6234594.1 glucose/arabinose dehydrogenase/cytochrome c551/c552 [Mucilaginibacter sp. FT3.2]